MFPPRPLRSSADVVGLYFTSMLLTVVSNVGYHLSQRSISTKINPLLSLAITYTIALVITLVAFPFFAAKGSGSLAEQIRSANWATYVLGFFVVALELGFLLVYRAGWKVGIAALFCNALVTILLIPVGVLFLKEQLDLSKIVGVGFALLGLWLIGRN